MKAKESENEFVERHFKNVQDLYKKNGLTMKTEKTMKLTGKCKDDFEKWAMINATFIYDYAIENDDKTGIPTDEGRYFHYQDIDDFPNSFKFGVYVDFARERNLIVKVNYNAVSDNYYILIIEKNTVNMPESTHGNYHVHYNGSCSNEYIEDEPEAQTASIKKFDKIYNQR